MLAETGSAGPHPHKPVIRSWVNLGRGDPGDGYWNVIRNSIGHAWQGRYFSRPLEGPHLWEALRYTELNPVRARLVAEPHAWACSSAAAHCAVAQTLDD